MLALVRGRAEAEGVLQGRRGSAWYSIYLLLWRGRSNLPLTFLSGLSRQQSTVPAALHEHTTWRRGAVFRAIPCGLRSRYRLFSASVGRRLPPCALAEVAAGCGSGGSWRRLGGAVYACSFVS